MDRREFLKQAGAIIGLVTIPVGNLFPKPGFGAILESTPKPETALQANQKYSEFPGLAELINTGRIDACTQGPCIDVAFFTPGRVLSDDEINNLFRETYNLYISTTALVFGVDTEAIGYYRAIRDD